MSKYPVFIIYIYILGHGNKNQILDFKNLEPLMNFHNFGYFHYTGKQ